MFLIIYSFFEIPFNSRPHKEVDSDGEKLCIQKKLSIHDLTRRSTDQERYLKEWNDLSIHDLTRRSTR